MMFLSQHGHNIKCRASRKRYGNQFNRFGSSRPGGVVQDDVVPAAGFRNELPVCLQRLCETYPCFNHRTLPMHFHDTASEQMHNRRICYSESRVKSLEAGGGPTFP